MLGVPEAIDRLTRWATIEAVGDSTTPLLAVDFRGASGSDHAATEFDRAAAALAAAPWVTVSVVDAGFNDRFSPLADATDVVIGESTRLPVAVDVGDVDQALARLKGAVAASPEAAVALVQLLRLTSSAPVEQALHAESLTYGLLQTGATFRRWLADREPRPEQAEPASVVAIERRGSLLTIRLDRSHRRNALNIAMRDQLTEALELLDADRSLDGAVLSGRGANFCAGGDLDEFGLTPSPATGHHVRSIRSLPRLVHRVRDRLRVHLHGACVGAGIELPAFAHAVIAHPDTSFRLPEIGFGLVPGAGGTVSVTRRCGRHRATWLALTGATLDSATALAWGLVDRIDEAVAGPD